MRVERPWLKLTAHLHLVSRLRMGGAIPLFYLYVFMELTEQLYLYL